MTEVTDNAQEVTNETAPEATNVEETTQVDQSPESEQAAVEGATAAGEQVPAYEPNFSYKYAVEGSKQEEKEFDDLFRGIIKDADSEKAVRELHERAYGLDFVKKDRDDLKTKYTDVHTAHEEQTKALQVAGSYVKHKDFGSFFKVMGIPQHDVLQWAVELAQYHQMSPQEQQVYNNQLSERQRLADLEYQNNQMSTNYQQMATQQRAFELDTVLSRPDVQDVVGSFDNRMGRSGAFREEVIKRGQMYAHQGQDVSAQQVVTELIGLVGHVAQDAPPQAAQQEQPQKKPVIPNITGKGTSPVKRVPKSVEDLQKIHAEMIARS